MKRLTIAQMENVSGGDISTLSACFKAMYDVNEAAGALASAKTFDEISNAMFNIGMAWGEAQKSCGEL